jgi:hypothetical protein
MIAEILSIKIDPRSYCTADAYLRDAQALSLFSKRERLPIAGIDRRAAALTKWWHGEHECYRSNERISKLDSDLSLSGVAVRDFSSRVRKKISQWIGPTPPVMDNLHGRFGPGATFSDKGRLTTVPDKMTSTPTLTRDSFWYILPYLQTKWGRNNQENSVGLSFVRGNRYQTVPKTSLTDRSIAIEPSINVFYQLAFGSSIRRRLKFSTGWDLTAAADIHRDIARESSISNEFCTIDLSNASDTVCHELVRLLMPPAWYEELAALRSPFTYVDGHWVLLEKFSSMGNGFTFELETLIFAALLSTVLEENGAMGALGVDLFVFGDDIIIPTRLAREATAVLKFFGFSLNETKSFVSHEPFRESCGGDYFLGSDVRPYYLKKEVNDPLELYPFLNATHRALEKIGVDVHDGFSAWNILLDSIPINLRCFGPDELGDNVLRSPPEKWKYKWKDSIRYFRCVNNKPFFIEWSHWKPSVVLASALYGYGDGLLGVTPRDPPRCYRLTWVPLS